MNAHRVFPAIVVWLMAFACSGRAEERISLSRGLDEKSEEYDKYHSYFRQIDQLVDTQYPRLNVSDQNDLKQLAVANILERFKNAPNVPTSATIIVRKAYDELFGKRKRDLKRVTIEGINVASVLDDHDTLLDHARSLPAAERDECMCRLKRLERDEPEKFGDLLAYVCLVRCKGVTEPEALLSQFASTFPKAATRAKESLQEARNTVWKRVRGYFGTALEYLCYAVLVVLAICLLGWLFGDNDSVTVSPPPPAPPAPATWQVAADEARRVEEERRRAAVQAEARRVEEEQRRAAAHADMARCEAELHRQREQATPRAVVSDYVYVTPLTRTVGR